MSARTDRGTARPHQMRNSSERAEPRDLGMKGVVSGCTEEAVDLAHRVEPHQSHEPERHVVSEQSGNTFGQVGATPHGDREECGGSGSDSGTGAASWEPL